MSGEPDPAAAGGASVNPFKLARPSRPATVSQTAVTPDARTAGDSPADPPVFEPGFLREQLDGDREACRLVLNTFLQDAPARLTELQEVLRTQDLARMTRLAHAFKGSAGNIGAAAVQQAAAALERASREHDLSLVQVLAPRLEFQLTRLVERLKAELAS